jgi:hypothetical protein
MSSDYIDIKLIYNVEGWSQLFGGLFLNVKNGLLSQISDSLTNLQRAWETPII